MENYADLMFDGAVADLQKADGTYEKYQTAYGHRTADALGPDETQFITARDSFYIASLTQDGWPYIQHRGGARGFVSVTGPTTLALADYRGNRQFITMGNLATDNRVSLFFMDYLNHARLKVQGKATLVKAEDADAALLATLDTTAAPAERVMVIEVIALDWNCPKYIPTLYSEDAIRQVIGPKMGALQAENEALRAELAALKDA
jgi:predicted pyridoxine 5'-phosphate oxidase superfamily flavin-nucleotide-binding protein